MRLADITGLDDLSDTEINSKLAQLDGIAAEVAKVETPTSYAEELYSLRLHIDFVRRKLQEAAERHPTQPDKD